MSRGVLGIFEGPDGMMRALEQAREQGVEIIDVYTPVPDHRVPEFVSPAKSPVRYVTFTGGVMGLTGGMWLAIGTSLVWNLIVGGKPVTSIIPFLVIGFEMTILIGALATFTALLLFGGMPYRKFPAPGYRPEFSFGVWLGGSETAARKLLQEAGAVEVQVVAGKVKQ